MNAVRQKVDPKILDRIAERARWLPEALDRDNSREADKFVIRYYAEVSEELERLASLGLRSKNAEVCCALMDSIHYRHKSRTILHSLIHYLGDEVSTRVLELVPEFRYADCRQEDKFVVRFPTELRSAIARAAQDSDNGDTTMIGWVRATLLYWINAQRQIHALQDAVVNYHFEMAMANSGV